MNDRSPPVDPTATAGAPEYGEHSPFQAAEPDPLLTRMIPELSGLTATIGPEHFYPTVQAAAQAFATRTG